MGKQDTWHLQRNTDASEMPDYPKGTEQEAKGSTQVISRGDEEPSSKL